MLDLLHKAGSLAAPAPRVLMRSVQADTSAVGCRHPKTSCSQPTLPISCSQPTKASPQMQGQHTEHLIESGCRGASASDWEHKAAIAHAVGTCQEHPTDTHLLQQVSAAYRVPHAGPRCIHLAELAVSYCRWNYLKRDVEYCLSLAGTSSLW